MQETRQDLFDKIEAVLSECREIREKIYESQVRQQRIIDDVEKNLMPKFKAVISEHGV